MTKNASLAVQATLYIADGVGPVKPVLLCSGVCPMAAGIEVRSRKWLPCEKCDGGHSTYTWHDGKEYAGKFKDGLPLGHDTASAEHSFVDRGSYGKQLISGAGFGG